MSRVPRHLHFDKKYIGKLVLGRKTTTVRLGKKKFREGQIVFVHAGGFVLGKARITRVQYKKLGELSLEEIKKDGFKSKEELLEALYTHYKDKNITDDTYVTIIEFELIDKFKEPVPDRVLVYGRLDPREVARTALEHEKELNLAPHEKEILRMLVREGSIRRVAARLGGMHRREIVRRIVRKVMYMLDEMGLLKEE